MKSLLLVDVSGLYWSSWHATADQEVSAAFEKTVSKVVSLREGYDHVAIAVDSPPYDRKKLFPGYKANREAAPPQAIEQFDRVKRRLIADGMLLWAVPGFEADDVIATACKLARGEYAVTIASGDKDLLSLVDDTNEVRMVSTSNGTVYTEAAVIEKFGVVPALMGELLALTGDTSDNIPGVPGIGPKNAAKLLEKHGPTALDVVANVADIENERFRELVKEHADGIKLACDLVWLRHDAPINIADLLVERPLQSLIRSEPEAKPEPAKQQAIEVAKPEQGIVLAPSWSLALEPRSGASAWKLAQALFESRLYQKFTTPQAILAVILRGRSLGLDTTTALDLFHVIEGRPSMHADLIVGLVLRSGFAETFELLESTDERATYVTKRKGDTKSTELTWDLARACKANLVERKGDRYVGVSKSGRASNWDKYPRTMLRHRCGTELARAKYPDVVSGLYTPDEVSDGSAAVGEFVE